MSHRSIAWMALALALAACEQPPTHELQSAEKLLQEARAAEADVYLSERFRAAEQALADANAKVAQKDYKGATSQARIALERARTVAVGAPLAKSMLKSEAETTLAFVQSALDSAAAVRQEAVDAQLPDGEVFVELEPRVQQLTNGIAAVTQQLAGGDVRGGAKAADALKLESADLGDAFRSARVAWDEAHPPKPKGKTKATKKGA